MNKFAKKFLVVSLVTLSGLASASTKTNKTHLQPRPAGVNLAMERTTWNTQINKVFFKEDDKFGGSLQAVGFYEQSTNGGGLGKYFGFGNRNGFSVGAASSDIVGRIDRRNLIHSAGAATYPFGVDGVGVLSGNLKLNFEHRQGGVRFDYFQDLNSLVSGLYFHVHTPIVWSQTRSTIGLTSSVTQTVDEAGKPTKTLADYFSGNITQSEGYRQQAALRNAKIAGNKSKTSLADIDLKLGWNFWETVNNHAGVNIGGTIPTSPSAKGEYLFEPMGGGNGQHWGLGGGLDIKVTPWKKKSESIAFQFIVDYRYIFESQDIRTLGLNKNLSPSIDPSVKNWGQYFLAGRTGVTGVQPLANIITQKVNVKIGSQVDLLAGFVYSHGGFTLDLGYELYGREAEGVTKREALANETYGLAGYDYDAREAFSSSTDIPSEQVYIYQAAASAVDQSFLKDSEIVTDPAETPSQISNKFYGGLGYCFNKWETPLMLGLGGAYEFASLEKGLQQWGIWGKIGLSF